MRRRSPRRGRRRGVALAEALIGGMMLAAGMMVVLNLSTRSLRAQVHGEKRLTAAWLADDLLNMVLAEGPEEFDRDFDSRGVFEAPFEEFRFEVLTEDLGPGVPQRVTAIVQWGDGPNESVVVETLISLRLDPDSGEEEPPREPFEEVDRDERWYGDEEDAP